MTTTPTTMSGGSAVAGTTAQDTGTASTPPATAGPRNRHRRTYRSLLSMIVVLVSAVAGVTVAAAPAQAAYPSTSFGVYNWAEASGNFIWYNRSVQVGGGVWAGPLGSGICGAVVFTAYDQHGNQVARAARPGDNVYTCSGTRYGYGFTLDAANVVGGIRSVRVDLWEWQGDYVGRGASRTYYRP